MNDDFDRDGLISLLQELNSEDDEKVLKAARALRGGMRASGRSWDDLLRDSNDESPTREETAEDIDDDDDDDNDSEDETEDKQATTSVSMDNDEALKLIDKMLKKFSVSASMREELKGYKEDIADGEFEASDRQYLRALHARLSKSQQS